MIVVVAACETPNGRLHHNAAALRYPPLHPSFPHFISAPYFCPLYCTTNPPKTFAGENFQTHSITVKHCTHYSKFLCLDSEYCWPSR